MKHSRSRFGSLNWMLNVAVGGLVAVLTGNPAWAATVAASDAFNAVSYSGSTGTAPWVAGWTEFGETNGASTGVVRVTTSSYCASTACLRIGGASVNIDARGVRRGVNLNGATAAALSYTYRRVSAGSTAAGSVRVDVSGDGVTWQAVDTIPLVAATEAGGTARSIDLMPLNVNKAAFQLRFVGAGTSATGYVYIDNVSVTFDAANAAPVATDDSYSLTEDTALSIAAPGVLGNDKDVEKNALSASVAVNPTKGVLALGTNGAFTYTPNLNASGTDSFTYKANDGTSDSNIATVRLNITNVNDPPVFTPPTTAGYAFNVRLDSAVGTQVGRVTATDPDSGDTRTYSITAGNTNNALSINASTGSILVANFAATTVGPLNLTVRATDKAGAYAEVPVTVSVTEAHKVVDMKLLVLATGTETEDMGLAYIGEQLKQLGVPYEAFDVSRNVLTDTKLRPSPYRGAYYGVILTNSELTVSHNDVAEYGQNGMSLAEWQLLHLYERDFQARESVISGWPAVDPSRGLNYGAANVVGGTGFQGLWQLPAGGTQIYEYVNASKPLPITDWAYGTEASYAYAMTSIDTNSIAPTLDPSAPPVTVQPLLMCDTNTAGLSDTGASINCPANSFFVSLLRYNDGREVLLSTISNASWLLHSQVLAYEFVNFASKGVFLGSRQVYLAAHVDDVFVPDDLWDATLKTTVEGDGAPTFLMSAAEVSNTVMAQSAFRVAHPLANTFALDMVFNGAGADAAAETYNKATTDAFVANRSRFRFINHTYSHLDMDARRDAAMVQTGPNYAQASDEVVRNMTLWQTLGLPDRTNNLQVLVSGEHSGLRDRRAIPVAPTDPLAPPVEPLPEIPFVEGVNAEFINAALDSGVKYIAGDSSQVNQNKEMSFSVVNPATGQTRSMLMLPRWPTSIFYNTPTKELLVDEYNWIFHDRYLVQVPSVDPCSVAAAICTVRTYEQILEAEADTTVRHMLSYKSWPHYFHQTNLHNYGAGKTLIFDWLNAAMTKYESLMKLPVKNLAYHQIGLDASNRLNAASAGVQGTWDLMSNQVSIKATKTATVTVTGLEAGTTGTCVNGSYYGGQCQVPARLGTTALVMNVNQALTR